MSSFARYLELQEEKMNKEIQASTKIIEGVTLEEIMLSIEKIIQYSKESCCVSEKRINNSQDFLTKLSGMEKDHNLVKIIGKFFWEFCKEDIEKIFKIMYSGDYPISYGIVGLINDVSSINYRIGSLASCEYSDELIPIQKKIGEFFLKEIVSQYHCHAT